MDYVCPSCSTELGSSLDRSQKAKVRCPNCGLVGNARSFERGVAEPSAGRKTLLIGFVVLAVGVAALVVVLLRRSEPSPPPDVRDPIVILDSEKFDLGSLQEGGFKVNPFRIIVGNMCGVQFKDKRIVKSPVSSDLVYQDEGSDKDVKVERWKEKQPIRFGKTVLGSVDCSIDIKDVDGKDYTLFSGELTFLQRNNPDGTRLIVSPIQNQGNGDEAAYLTRVYDLVIIDGVPIVSSNRTFVGLLFRDKGKINRIDVKKNNYQMRDEKWRPFDTHNAKSFVTGITGLDGEQYVLFLRGSDGGVPVALVPERWLEYHATSK